MQSARHLLTIRRRLNACPALYLALLVAVGVGSSIAAGEPTPGAGEIAGSSSSDSIEAAAAFAQQNPRTQFYRSGSRITRIHGKSFASGMSPESSAEQFVQNHALLFGVATKALHPESLLEDARHTQPVMYDAQTDSYKFTLVYYSQFFGDLPVFRADLRLLVRNESGYPLVLASANLRDLGNFELPRNPAPAQGFQLAKIAAVGHVPGLENFSQHELVIWAGVNDMVVEPQLAVSFTGDNRGVAGAATLEDWIFVAHATTGKILYRESRILHTDVQGSVSGLASQGPAADFCTLEISTPLPHAHVNIGATQESTDEFGDFVIPNGGDSEVTVQSVLEGIHFDVIDVAGPESQLSTDVFPPGPADFLHNALNSSELIRAQVNTYLEANVVRDWIVAANPNYPLIGLQTGFPGFVNRTDGFCPGNAWYDPAQDSINFCRAGGGFPNTSWTSVIYHEYGHHLVAAGGSGQGQYGEGVGDVMSTIILDDPRLGLGFFGNCAESLRNADNNMQYPCNGAIHTCGQLISGCVWDTRNELIVTEPDNYQTILMSLMVNSVLEHSGNLITPAITIDWLTLDDDDDDIGNGTPHYFEIAAGFGAHNMDAPELNLINFIYPNGRPDLITPGQPTTIEVIVESETEEPTPGSGTVSYRIGNAGAFTTESMLETSPNQYEATLPGVDCLDTVQYFFSASTDGAGTISDPQAAPNDFFSTVSASGVLISFEDDFETDQGWSVNNSPSLADGAWIRGVPLDCNRGDPPTDADGSGQAYVTDNSCADGGNSDVDDGSTTLTSPIMNANIGSPVISYDRWFSNTFGNSPFQDVFIVEVSDDGGSSWLGLETVGPAGPEVDGGWFHKEFQLSDVPGLELTDQFRIRFVASDTDPQSVVEAGVDGIELFSLECEELCAADLNGDGAVGPGDLAILLGAWGPNPGHPADFNGDGEIGPADLAALLAAWGDCP